MAKLVMAGLLLAVLTGCSLQMGNMKVGMLEGWNQPTSTTTDKTTVTSAPVANQQQPK